jgi:acylphosphatase
MSDRVRVRVIVRGMVQGVGYRYFAAHLARDYGISGWVRNREDGAVELEAEGESAIVNSFLKDLGIGPRSADVTGLAVEEVPPEGDEKGFTVRF